MTTNTPAEGDVRFTIVLTHEQRELINAITTKYKVTQPEVIKVLVDRMVEEDIAPALIKIRETKVQVRALAKNSSLIEKFSKLTPAQLAALEAITKEST